MPLDNPVRDKPDYNEQIWSADEREKLTKEENLIRRIASSFVRDWRSGIFTEALNESARDDCLIEYGVTSKLHDTGFQNLIAKVVNNEITRIERAKVAARDTVGVRLAAAFGSAIREGRIAKRSYYTRAQAESFLCGAIGEPEKRVLAEFAIAHNINNDDCGRVEIEAGRMKLIPVMEQE